MGSVVRYETARKEQRYMVRYRTPDRRQTDKRGFKTKREAELFLASVEVSKARGDFIDESAARVAVRDLGTRWIETRTHLKPSSFRPLEIAWRLHVEPRWGKVPVGQVQHSDVQGWVTGLSAEKSATTVLRAYGILASILDVAVADRRVPTNRARGVKLPRKVPKEHVYLTHQQVHDLADASGGRRTLVLVLAYTGLRWGEAIGLRVRDLDLLRRRLNVNVNAVEVGGDIEVGTPKTHKRRSLVFPAFLANDLARACEGKGRDDLVFSDKHGAHLRRTRVSDGSRSWFKTALVTAGLEPMTIHGLRHTAASLAVSSGANVKAVQRMLGHASAAMTLDVYADLFDDDLEALADRLDHAARESIVGKTWAGGASQ
ncbi:site-specific integrase [Curtobacterium sp. MCBD17_013]|uniref:tyrosine-type recombinase/integrase n=1 Tax=Curtobacterium sp. MCBD17_013 TaxID=2175668 RepID=UPI000DA80B8A|nr:tyrosine-type recombinase/integrase [Curtobacterium sp. MCBD17_013]PZF63330.1 site-specific integrase [Curtobacterium sp. MCBD17_013]